MLCRDVMNVIEKEYPLNYALSWDNVGLLMRRSCSVILMYCLFSVRLILACFLPSGFSIVIAGVVFSAA